MKQPAPPGPVQNNTHDWPDAFIVDWSMYFVPDENDEPPYTPYPKTSYNVTTGKTYYFTDANGVHNMKEVYDEYCIPVFGDPSSSMGSQNHYSCDFLNVGSTQTAFVVLHEDKPVGAPDCCIIGQPFHPPPPNFYTNMPVRWQAKVEDDMVDWNAVWDVDAGIFNYGFNQVTSEPYAFYMIGVPWVTHWMWQRFSNFRAEAPPTEVWKIPSACAEATACPGWEPSDSPSQTLYSLVSNN
eukprot:CAMPEP_0174259334 /NCGR_PEP_ID=MMETSP0439-20130205/8168_1 /TAXON_ID=0 /ORGANISM="Stereomyxa ramosa, Strain Chinc5" /LENGTH=238 /DNA_ID=CAMNT_0015343165 /DNA_START=178 /DNA_END=894 /DNA_ORIENTATION=+